LLGLAAIISSVVLAIFLLSRNPPAGGLSPDEIEAKRQQDALEVITRDLDAGKTVKLIGEGGGPAYFRWRTDDSLAKIPETPDGIFSVQHWEFGLLELLPDPRHDHFRFSAEVRHEREPLREGKEGIYFGHSEHPDGNTSAHFYCAVAFNDLIEQVAVNAVPNQNAKNTVRLEAHRQPPKGIYHDTADILGTNFLFTPAVALGAPRLWRNLAVEVRPEAIEFSWEGKWIAKTTRANLMKSARTLLSGPDDPATMNPQFAPRDGLGLFVTQGVASFRNVTIEPIK
jgi:hypothetical protein